MRVVVARPERPLIWLDTSVFIKITRAESKRPDGNDGKMAKALGDLVKQLVRDRKVLCIESDQSREVSGRQKVGEVTRLIDQMSRGVRIRSKIELEERQIWHAMKAYLRDENIIGLGVLDFFNTNPDEHVERISRQGFWVSISNRGENQYDTLNSLFVASKRSVTEGFERIRQQNLVNGVKFEAQVGIEKKGFLLGQLESLREWKSEIEKPSPDLFKVWSKQPPIFRYSRMWSQLGGELKELLNFFELDHFLSLPCNHISHTLIADLVTDPQRVVQSGDMMDVNHIAAILPIATWVFTDKDVAARVRRRRLAESWNSRVFSSSTFKELYSILEDL